MEILNYYIDYIKKNLAEIDLNKEPQTLYEPIRYGIECGGKRFRPALILFLCDLYGG